MSLFSFYSKILKNRLEVYGFLSLKVQTHSKLIKKYLTGGKGDFLEFFFIGFGRSPDESKKFE